ncbi:MAG: hypothetical protein VR73_15485 [Gammaproteobacteria bacterium BRH_c0]|nr:MAG: hypothetical protein VR73_15485 [Gammaproteobacteria bacterium BRH_c0]
MEERFLGRFTLLQQWAAATVLAIIPLLLAVSYAVLALQQQTSAQQRLVEQMDLLSSRNSSLSGNVLELVRIARQYQLLRDESFMVLYRQKAEALDEQKRLLQVQLPEAASNQVLETISVTAGQVLQQLSDPQLTPAALAPALQSLVEYSDQLTQMVNQHRRAALGNAEREFSRIVDQLFLLTVLALPGTFLLMLIGAFMVSRPIWRLSQAIKGLGKQQWDQPIAIPGPADLVDLGQNLEWMRQQVVASDRQKKAFIQHVTHELKTPLAGIIEAASLLHDEVPAPLHPGQKPVLDILSNNARNLQDLIQQLLNYNAVSHGMMTHLGAVAIGDMCEAIRHNLETANPGRDIHWEFSGSPSQIETDARLLDMILKNLLGNAFQFSADSSCIRVSWAVEDSCWQLTVADQGPGIDADEIEHIFTPFYKGRSGRQLAVPKNGIGLAVVQESVNLLNGQIKVDSKPGHGTVFRLVFPLVAAP